MSYSFAPHLAQLAPSAARTFALVDASQIARFAATLQRKLPGVPYALVFEDTFAQSGLELSPVLIEISDVADTRQAQLLMLDELCKHLPVMGVLHSTHTAQELLQHLRALLIIEADTTPYMLRFADTQMLAATTSILNADQRACFFYGIQVWYVVDHHGRVHNLAQDAQQQQDLPPVAPPLKIDAQQTDALLGASAVPILASQVRNQEASFAEQLSHAQQCAFIDNCVGAAKAQWLEENAWPEFAKQRWQEQAQVQAQLAQPTLQGPHP